MILFCNVKATLEPSKSVSSFAQTANGLITWMRLSVKFVLYFLIL